MKNDSREGQTIVENVSCYKDNEIIKELTRLS